jgi:glycosyltransferase involved in cell wall biosynthesis
LGRFWAGWLKLENPVLVNYVPTLGHAQKCWPWRKVYHCVDLWSAFGMYDAAVMEEMDSLCCREADVVVATSKDLYERCRKKNPNTHLVTHGVDHSHFAQALRAPGEAPEGRRQKSEDKSRKTETPIRNHESRIISSTPTPTLPADPSARARSSTEEASLAEKGDSPARLPRPADLPPGRIVGFFGLLSEWLDQELVVALAGSLKPGVGSQESEASTDRRIAATVVLIGQADVDISRFRSDPNVVLLGPRAFDELPSYVAHFDVGIIPFIVNELTVAVNPIKLREMLSAGCPVVSVDLPEVRAYAGARRVEVARGREAFLAAVRSLLANPLTQAECASLSASMASETWESKVDEMLRHIGAGSVGSD